MPATPAEALVLKDALTIGIAVTSLIVTVLWNLHNRRHTDRVALKIRADAYETDRWKSQRDEVLRLLRKLEGAAARIVVLHKGAHSREDLLAEINKNLLAMTEAYMALYKELERCTYDCSWGPLAEGKIVDGESDWDRLNSILSEAGDLPAPEDIRLQLPLIDDHIRSIAVMVNGELRVRDAELDPANK